jgi:PAS domain S-box-containing protein
MGAVDMASHRGAWPADGGEMGVLIRAHDWSATPLGAIGRWPERLRAAVDNCLDMGVASFVWWGRDLIQLYNDRALVIVQAKHPAVFGVPAREAWSDVWPAVGPIIERVMSTGRPVLSEDMPVVPNQGGPCERTCFIFSYSALRQRTGAVAGIFVTASETTKRVHAEPALLHRTLFEAMDEGCALADVILDETGRAVDVEYVEANSAAIRAMGDDATDNQMAELGLDCGPYWYEICGRVARTGKGERVERYSAQFKRWFNCYVFKPAPNDRESRRVAVVFQDVTERRNAHAMLSGRRERQAFLLKLSDALQPLGDPDKIQATACQMLGEHLGVNRVHYADVEGDEFILRPGYTNGVAPFSRRGPISLFGEAARAALVKVYRRGEAVAVDDVAVDPRFTDAERRILGAAEIAAFACVMLIKNSRWVGVFGLHSAARRKWTKGDLNLARVVAERAWSAAERARTEAALRESETRLRQFGDASSNMLWIRDAETLQWEYLSPAFEMIHGEARGDVLKGDNLKNWADLIVSEDRERVLANIARVRSGEHVTFEYRIRRPSDGEIRWLRDIDFPFVDGTGRVQRIGGIGHDVTGEKATAERMAVMVAELQHRTRNLIAVVGSIISRTLAASPSPDAFKLRIDDRLSALSRVQGLLSRAEQVPITIGALVRLELDALGRDVRREQVDIAGPEVRLRSSIVQTLALALHELATNARKYGAFSTDQGRLRIAWQLEQRGNASWLALSWIEENAGRAGAPSGHKGYGRELIEQALPYSHGAETRYDLDETGLRCSIALPLDADGRQARRL